MTLPWRAYASTNVYYGSGFTNGAPGQPYPGDYLPAHTTFDLIAGQGLRRALHRSRSPRSTSPTAASSYDNSLTYGGFHWNLPAKSSANFATAFITDSHCRS